MSEVWQVEDHPENRLAASSTLRSLSKSPPTKVTWRLNIIGIDILIILHNQKNNNSYIMSKFKIKILHKIPAEFRLENAVMTSSAIDQAQHWSRFILVRLTCDMKYIND